MPIGLAIGGAVAGIGGALIGSSATKSAANKAAEATTQAADRSAAVVERNYDRSAAALQPWQTSGLEANRAVNSLLGLGQQQGQQGLPTQQPNALAQFSGFSFDPFSGGGFGGFDLSQFMNAPANLSPAERDAWYANPARYDQNGMPIFNGFNQAATAQPQAPTQQENYQGAFDNYRNSTGYQFRLGEGMRALNSGWAGAGTLQSGAAGKDFIEYGQNFGSGEFGNYLGALGNQQSMGLDAARAQAGVGGNASNSLASIYQNQGNNLANAALVNGQNNAQLANSLGTIGSNLFGQLGGSGSGGLQPVQYAANSLGGAPLRLY